MTHQLVDYVEGETTKDYQGLLERIRNEALSAVQYILYSQNSLYRDRKLVDIEGLGRQIVFPLRDDHSVILEAFINHLRYKRLVSMVKVNSPDDLIMYLLLDDLAPMRQAYGLTDKGVIVQSTHIPRWHNQPRWSSYKPVDLESLHPCRCMRIFMLIFHNTYHIPE